MTEEQEVKKKLNDARSKFMVRFLYLETIILNDHSFSLIANFFNPCSRFPRQSRPCERQDRRPSATCRLFKIDLFESYICSQDQIFRRLQFINETLGDRVVPQAKYDSKEQKNQEYHKETAKIEGMLNEIEQWARTPSDTKNKNCWWILSRPAVGKPSIGAKVAKTFQNEKSLFAQYFVTRDVAATTDPHNILLTMAQQLAEKSPLAALIIRDKLETPLSIVKEFLDGQAQALLLEPLRAIAQYAPKVFVVIYGVDELANSEPSVISKVTSVLCSITSDLPANVKILIFSRPEQWITDKIPLHIRRVDFAIKASQDNVERLVRAKLGELAEFHKWKDWPSEDQITLLCRLAGGHSPFAMTTLRWIASQLEWEGSARRDEVIEEVSKTGEWKIFMLSSLIAFFLLRSQLGGNIILNG